MNITKIETFTKDVIVMACRLEAANDIIKRIIRVGELKKELRDPAGKMMRIAREYLHGMPETENP